MFLPPSLWLTLRPTLAVYCSWLCGLVPLRGLFGCRSACKHDTEVNLYQCEHAVQKEWSHGFVPLRRVVGCTCTASAL